MNKSYLPPDDLPPYQATQLDELLRRKLEKSTSRLFYKACDRITQILLFNCDWYVTTNASILTLIIACPSLESYWHILSAIEQIGNRLERFSSSAKIRVCPPVGKGKPFEIGVNELSTYRDSRSDE